MDRRLTREALRLLEAHQPFVRATVVRVQGSTPGKMGASMIIRSDGSFEGTVGGAALEERVKELARNAFEQREGDLAHFDLAAWKEGGLPSLCGGSVDVAIEYVAARPNLLLWGGGHVARAIAELLPALDCSYTVADDRPEWIGEDRFPYADDERRSGRPSCGTCSTRRGTPISTCSGMTPRRTFRCYGPASAGFRARSASSPAPRSASTCSRLSARPDGPASRSGGSARR